MEKVLVKKGEMEKVCKMGVARRGREARARARASPVVGGAPARLPKLHFLLLHHPTTKEQMYPLKVSNSNRGAMGHGQEGAWPKAVSNPRQVTHLFCKLTRRIFLAVSQKFCK